MLELIDFLIKKDYEICLMSFLQKAEHDEEEIEKFTARIPEKKKIV